MEKIKLVDGTIINASKIGTANGIFKITTTEYTVEELAEIFTNKENISKITLLTESETECGYKEGFTSFAGITYDAEGNKTVELFQPKDVTEARISNAEAKLANSAESIAELSEDTYTNAENIVDVQAQVDYIAMMSDIEM